MPIAEEPKRTLPVWSKIAGVMIFKVPTGETYTLSEVTMANTDTTQRYNALYHVPDGDTMDTEYMFFPAPPIKPAMVVEGGRGKVFEEGDELWTQADDDDQVNVGCSYVRRYTV